MQYIVVSFFLFVSISLSSCTNEKINISTKSVIVAGKKCTVQKMPDGYQDGMDRAKSKFDYYRVLIESNVALKDSSSLHYVNFGIENSLKKIVKNDTLYPAFVQRIANGKKSSFEYLVSFEKYPDEMNYEILFDDQIFEMGIIKISF